MNLRERLQELVGKNPGGCEEHSVVPGMLCLHGDCINARAINHHKALQRKQVEQSAATIAADLKGMLPEREKGCWKHSDGHMNCNFYDCQAAYAVNESITKTEADIDRYCGVEGME